MNKAFETYYGGKNGAGVYQQIINEMRPHDVYLELFLGNGAVYRAKKAARLSVLNDLDPIVVTRWAAIGIDISNYSAGKLLADYDFRPELRYCLYLDPPYPVDSRRTARLVYNCEMNDQQHVDLLNTVNQLPKNVDVLISTYNNPIYSDMLSDWRLKTFTGQTRNGPATEYLYMNYPATGVLHDYGYLGVDFIDRQRIKRKIDREVGKLSALPVTERNAILSQLITSFSIDINDFGRQ